MKLPKQLSILGQPYQLKRVRGLIAKENIEGYVMAHKYLIVIDSSLKGEYMRRVLYHEIAHAFCYESGLHEFLSAQSLEMFCQSFSSLWSQLKI